MTVLAAALVVAGCDGNPLATAEEDPVTTDEGNLEPVMLTPVPPAIAENLESFDYDPVAKTFTVNIASLDGTPGEVVFARNTGAEAGLPPGVEAYSIQEDALDRLFVGLVKVSNDGSTRATVVSDGGQFNRFFRGALFERDGGFTPPEGTGTAGTGQVSYAGDYTGLDNWSGPRPVQPPGTDSSIGVAGPGRVTGNVFINANFNDMALNGSVFNRVAIDRLGQPTLVNLDTLILIPGDIAMDGTFEGTIEKPGEIGATIGTYGGIFGGTDAESLAGALVITNFIDELDNESEHGIFVLTQCGRPGEDAALCTGTAP